MSRVTPKPCYATAKLSNTVLEPKRNLRLYRDKKVCVIVRAFNEERLIGRVIETMPAFVDWIVIVDDCSKDSTIQVAKSSNDPRVIVIAQEVNTGAGGATVSGHAKALELGADIHVVIDGDNQMDTSVMPRLMDPLIDEGYGFSKANRFFSSSSYEGMPRHRVFGNMVLTLLTKVSSGYWNTIDPQNGYTAMTRATAQSIPWARVAQRYEFENDQLIWLNIANTRIIDVPIEAIYGDEVSGIRLHIVVPRILGTLFKGFWRRMWLKHMLWSFSPVALFFLTGSVLFTFGIIVGIWDVAVAASAPGTVTTGSWLFSVAPALLGSQLLIQAVATDIQNTPK